MEKVKYKLPEYISETTGEVVLEEKEMQMVTRPDVPFRSITDLKKVWPGRVNTEPSVTNTAAYVPIQKTIAAILERHSMNELQQLGINDNIQHPEEYDGYLADEDGNLSYVGEDAYEAADQFDVQDNLDIYDQAADIQLQQSELAANVASEQSAATTTTQGGGDSEAVSGDDAA